MDMNERIRKICMDNGLSQDQFADKLGVSRQAVSKWESGQNTPDISNIIRICELFGTSCDYLIRGISCDSVADPDVADEKKQTGKFNSKKYFLYTGAGLAGILIWCFVPLICGFWKGYELEHFGQAFTDSTEYIWRMPVLPISILGSLCIILAAAGFALTAFRIRKKNI